MATLRAQPNLTDYDEAVRSFSWEQARHELAGLPGGRGLNIAHEAVDRHVLEGHGDWLAIRSIDRDGVVHTMTYTELREQTNRFANVVRASGLRRGDRVFSLLGREPLLHIAALGTLKTGSVFSPLFTAFGPEPISERLRLGDARVLVTTRDLYLKKVAPIRPWLPGLQEVWLVDADLPGTTDLTAAMAAAPTDFEVPPTDPEDMALLHFTSGTTGRPKAAVHAHAAVVAHRSSARFALDLQPGDVFWCTADPGWVTGMSYGVIAPLVLGITLVLDAGDLESRRWYRILQDHRVTVWYTAPTALRMLMRHGASRAWEYDLSALRFIASVGEALNPEAVVWGQTAFGIPVHDNWWQTETGTIMISNFAACEIRPGSMGRPLPGVEATVLRQGPDGRALIEAGHVWPAKPGAVGELALRPTWPSIFRGYLHDEQRYASSFADGWYLTGDLARIDESGYFWFVGRSDDVIKSSGHLIGPFEVESVLMEHPAVVEAGVIGVPDPIAGELVKAFVTVRADVEPTEQLRRELIAFGRRHLGSVAPREIAFDDHLPHTRSGKVLRRLLKAREVGLPEGDVSTLEPAT